MRPGAAGCVRPAHEGRTGRKGVPARCGVFFLSERAVRLLWGRFFCLRESGAAAVGTFFLPERAVRLLWGRFSARESARPLRTAPFAVLPGECCHAKRPRIAAETFFCPRECIDRRAQRLLPPDPSNVATQKCPERCGDTFFAHESAATVADSALSLPSGPAKSPRKNAPAQLRGRFSARESAATAAGNALALRPGKIAAQKRPRTTRGRFPLHCRS